MYSSLLLPTDGSDGSLAAIDAGLTLAASMAAEVHALFVIDERHVMGEFDAPVKAAEDRAERALEAVADAGAERSIAVEKHLRRGVPHREILDAIEGYDVDLVVMGTNGRTGVDRLVHLGSVTERVVRGSPVHVLTVPLRQD